VRQLSSVSLGNQFCPLIGWVRGLTRPCHVADYFVLPLRYSSISFSDVSPSPAAGALTQFSLQFVSGCLHFTPPSVGLGIFVYSCVGCVEYCGNFYIWYQNRTQFLVFVEALAIVVMNPLTLTNIRTCSHTVVLYLLYISDGFSQC
jgi:hypothetical protein